MTRGGVDLTVGRGQADGVPRSHLRHTSVATTAESARGLDGEADEHVIGQVVPPHVRGPGEAPGRPIRELVGHGVGVPLVVGLLGPAVEGGGGGGPPGRQPVLEVGRLTPPPEVAGPVGVVGPRQAVDRLSVGIAPETYGQVRRPRDRSVVGVAFVGENAEVGPREGVRGPEPPRVLRPHIETPSKTPRQVGVHRLEPVHVVISVRVRVGGPPRPPRPLQSLGEGTLVRTEEGTGLEGVLRDPVLECPVGLTRLTKTARPK